MAFWRETSAAAESQHAGLHRTMPRATHRWPTANNADSHKAERNFHLLLLHHVACTCSVVAVAGVAQWLRGASANTSNVVNMATAGPCGVAARGAQAADAMAPCAHMPSLCTLCTLVTMATECDVATARLGGSAPPAFTTMLTHAHTHIGVHTCMDRACRARAPQCLNFLSVFSTRRAKTPKWEQRVAPPNYAQSQKCKCWDWLPTQRVMVWYGFCTNV